jgi:DNA-binding HxlR family transcriptional regulator
MKVETISFKTEYAEKYGIECAILIQGIQLGLSLNKNKESHRKFGKVWMYNSIREWNETYPFMSQSMVKRALNKLKELDIIEVMQLDSNPMNKTNWYTLTNALGQNEPIEEYKMNQSNRSNCTNQNSINKQYKTNIVKQTSLEGEVELIFDECWKVYQSVATRQVGSKKDALAKFKRLNTDEIEKIRLHLPAFLKSHYDANKREFLPNFTTYLNQRRYEDEKLPYESKQENIDNWI